MVWGFVYSRRRGWFGSSIRGSASSPRSTRSTSTSTSASSSRSTHRAIGRATRPGRTLPAITMIRVIDFLRSFEKCFTSANHRGPHRIPRRDNGRVAASPVPVVDLNDGRSIPQLGLGVYKVPASEVEAVIRTALDVGYRHIDTATLYRNERGVGRAVRAAEVPREDLFVTTKLWNDDHGYDRALRAFDESMSRLGLDYVDLYLIHWPVPSRDLYVDTWRALERIREDGRARSIGVSN